jgi:hypothetical protein
LLKNPVTSAKGRFFEKYPVELAVGSAKKYDEL